MQDLLDNFLSTITETGRYICPVCSKTRKKQNERTLQVTFKTDGVVFHCHHCLIEGKRKEKKEKDRDYSPPPVRAISVPKISDDELISAYLAGRSINYSLVKDKFNVVSGARYFRAHGSLKEGEFPAIGFVYGNSEAVKWRALNDKRFTQDGAARIFWGIDQARKVETIDRIVITEGEIDALTIGAVIKDKSVVVLSAPNGAPARVSNRRVDPEDDTKFGYIWEGKDVLKRCDKIILGTDSDEAGEALAEELARRIGRAKCYSVSYPDGCKDFNDVLQKHGPEAVETALNGADPMPLEGVYTVDDYADDVAVLYKNGMIGGLSTGLKNVDELFTIVPGQLSVVTGIPGAGKSEFVDQLMVNLAEKYQWKFAVASFENPPPLHIAKLAEKIVGRPFFDGPSQKMSREEYDEALSYINKHWMFLEQKSGEVSTIDSILDRAQQAIMRMGVRGLVIDPYNYIAQSQKVDNEHQGINDLLTRLVSFARANQIHIWFIAHPAKMPTDAQGQTAVPKGMNISGSASFFAKADIGVTVHINKRREVEVHCWKIRFKWLGSVGKTTVQYDVPTGRYSDTVYDIHMPETINVIGEKIDAWWA